MSFNSSLLSRKLANLFVSLFFLELINVIRGRLMDSKLFVDRFLMANLSIVKFSEKKRPKQNLNFQISVDWPFVCVCVCVLVLSGQKFQN